MKYFRAMIEINKKTKVYSGYDADQKKAEEASHHIQAVKHAQGFRITDHWIESTEI